MSSWAEVDAWRSQVDAQQKKLVADALAAAERRRTERARAVERWNVERWFRELPVELAQVFADVANREPQLIGHAVCVANDWLLEHGFNAKTLVRWRKASARELMLIAAFQRCRFPPFTPAKAFAKKLDPERISDRQVMWLRKLVVRFRRQIAPAWLDPADQLLVAKKTKKRRAKQ